MRRPTRHPAWALVAVAPLLFGFKLFESRNSEVEQGNAALQAGKAEDALAHYDKAAAKLPADAGLHLDRGAALYALSRFAEAGQEFLRATEAPDESLKAAAFRNLGNALSKQDKPKEAIEAYKRALALRPDDKAAKWNLEIALRKQKEEEEKKKNDQNKDDKQDDKNKDKKDDKKQDDKDKKDDKKKDDKEKDKDKKSEQDKQDKKDEDKKDKQAQQQPEKPAQEQPERIQQMLQNLEANPKDLERERARLRAVRRAPPARDW
ncbi:MAG TPA: tetratricopeptide repeat protein [Polyangia bacterium]